MANIGGPIVVMFLVASNATAAHVRAGIMAYFSISGVYRIAVYFALGIYAMPYTAIALVLAVPYLSGIWLGTKLFSSSRRATPRHRSCVVRRLVALLK